MAALTACKDNSYTGDKPDDGFDPKNINNDREAAVTGRESNFVDDVIEENNEEIAWLNAAIKSGADAELKSNAQHMLADHEKMDTDLKAFAKKKGIEIEEADTTVIILDINENDAKDWDKEWADEMADKHRKLVRRFERAENFANDAELKVLISSSLPTLRAHLDMATKLEERLDKAD